MTHHWLEYPLARFDAGAPHWDPPLSAGLQSTEVSVRSMKRLQRLIVMHATLP